MTNNKQNFEKDINVPSKEIIDDKKYCILEKDGVGLCVCKHRPCEQLKAKEQECEELKEEKQKLIKENLEQKCKIRKLFDENATKEVTFKVNGKTATAKKNRVKQILDLIENPEQLEAYKIEAEKGKEINAELKAECENWEQLCKHADKQIEELGKENETLKQTLTEIKEIAEIHAPRCNDNAKCNYECEACHLNDLKQILQKISEVENEQT